MIVIGHSMGGLLAHTLVSDSGDALWNATFALPISKVDPNLKELPELKRLMYFEPKPYIKRVIFIAVPHRGSDMADGLLARYMARRVEMPDDLDKFAADLLKDAPGLMRPGAADLFVHGYPNSIEVLAPNSPELMALAKLPIDPAVPFHSIMGDRGLGGGTNSTDGVVPYWSSHLRGAASEAIVPSYHHAYDNPQAMAEVKRILLLHQEVPAKAQGLASEPDPQTVKGARGLERH